MVQSVFAYHFAFIFVSHLCQRLLLFKVVEVEVEEDDCEITSEVEDDQEEVEVTTDESDDDEEEHDWNAIQQERLGMLDNHTIQSLIEFVVALSC